MPASTNILTGPCRLLIGASAYAQTPDVLPARATPYRASWGGTWRDVGYTTDAGIVGHFEKAWEAVPTAQDEAPAFFLPGNINDFVSANLLEFTMQNIRDVLNRGNFTTIAPGVGAPGHDLLVLDDSAPIAFLAVGVEWVAPPNSKLNPMRIYMPLVMSNGILEFTANRGTTPGSFPAQFNRVGPVALSAPQIEFITTV